jgi:hypothetical protein
MSVSATVKSRLQFAAQRHVPAHREKYGKPIQSAPGADKSEQTL